MEKISHFFSDVSSSGRNKRSLLGLLVALLILPALLGVMACFQLPAPIGNPEKSRIDRDMTGMWATKMDEKDEEAWILILEPYDKRTWLVSWLILEFVDGFELRPTDISNGHVDIIKLIQAGNLVLSGISFEKGWLTMIKDNRFMVWEPKVLFESKKPMKPEFWWTMRVESVDKKSLTLNYINIEFDGFDVMEKYGEHITPKHAKKVIERVIRKNIQNPDLFLDKDDTPANFVRVPIDDYKYIFEVLEKNKITSTFY